MKTLQSDLTTPEQSRRLLELGVPADSADYFYRSWDCLFEHPCTDTSKYIHVRKTRIEREACYLHFAGNFPCWSVGRLIEIYELCYAQEFIRNVGMCLMEDVLSAICAAINDTMEQWDFSKLEG